MSIYRIKKLKANLLIYVELNENTPWHECHEVFAECPFNALDS